MNTNELIVRAGLEEYHRSGLARGASEDAVKDMGFFGDMAEVHEAATTDPERAQQEKIVAESLGAVVCGDCGVTIDEGCAHMVRGGGTRG